MNRIGISMILALVFLSWHCAASAPGDSPKQPIPSKLLSLSTIEVQPASTQTSGIHHLALPPSVLESSTVCLSSSFLKEDLRAVLTETGNSGASSFPMLTPPAFYLTPPGLPAVVSQPSVAPTAFTFARF